MHVEEQAMEHTTFRASFSCDIAMYK